MVNWDIDYLYEKEMDARIEEMYESSFSTVEHDTKRNKMWVDILGPDYRDASGRKKKKMKLNWCFERNIMPYQITSENYKMYCTNATICESTAVISPDVEFSLGKCEPSAQVYRGYKKNPPITCNNIPQEKEEAMTEYNMEIDQRNHLKRRLDFVKSDKNSEILEKYHMGFDNLPTTKEGILASLKAGNILFEDYCFDKDGHLKEDYNASNSFMLADPDRDVKGYRTAVKAVDKVYVETRDAIIIKPLADGLTALQSFEAMNF